MYEIQPGHAGAGTVCSLRDGRTKETWFGSHRGQNDFFFFFKASRYDLTNPVFYQTGTGGSSLGTLRLLVNCAQCRGLEWMELYLHVFI